MTRTPTRWPSPPPPSPVPPPHPHRPPPSASQCSTTPPSSPPSRTPSCPSPSLAFSVDMIAYLSSLGVSDFTLGCGRALTTLIAALPPLCIDTAIRRFGADYTGLIAVWLQVLLLGPIPVIFALTDHDNKGQFLTPLYVCLCFSSLSLSAFRYIETPLTPHHTTLAPPPHHHPPPPTTTTTTTVTPPPPLTTPPPPLPLLHLFHPLRRLLAARDGAPVHHRVVRADRCLLQSRLVLRAGAHLVHLRRACCGGVLGARGQEEEGEWGSYVTIGGEGEMVQLEGGRGR